jgi:IPT/TIG domain-containing protein
MKRMIHFHVRPMEQRMKPPSACAKLTTERPPQSRRHHWRLVAYVAGAILFLIALVEIARAGGPQYVAGVGYFDNGLAGKPVTWANGAITYYTDLGNLSPLLAGRDADAFVADAFSRWTSISTAAVSAARGGQLAEDVSGANVLFNADRTISMPIDIQPSATNKPIAIVYDADGAVTDALIGTGASTDCFTNATFGGMDAFNTDGHFAHALVILDGRCATTSSSLPDLKYRLVRVLGQIFGLGWSQLNVNAVTGTPQPTADALAGLPVMHAQDLPSCVPISKCYPLADQPKMDDRAALARLYPVTDDNLPECPGKQVFAESTGRIHGSVYFTDANGNRTQPMQGVNVVARWVDPGTHQPSGRYAAASVSGYLFSGDAGNAITGFTDALGQPYNRFGSNDAAVEGFFDLAGLEVPGGDSAQYQLSVELLDPSLSWRVGPYAPTTVQPSGSMQAIIGTIEPGTDVQQDVLMTGSAVETAESGEKETFSSPRVLPKTGSWVGAVTGYGDADYFAVNGQSNRTLTVEVTALDNNGQPTIQKAQPVIGMWSLAAPEGTAPPAYTSSPFNSPAAGVTQLNAQLLTATQFRVGISDLRGDGRPDFRYRARVIYGDSVTPGRISVRGNTPFEIEGIGFRPGMTVMVGNAAVTPLAVSANRMLAIAPALPDGVQNIAITDPDTGSSATLIGALTLGAGPNDVVKLAQGGNSPTPVGMTAATAIRVLVTSADGITPVSGATIRWTANNAATLSACSGASACYAFTDESGQVETRVTVGAIGTANISATLAPASYSPPKLVQASVNGTASAKDLALVSPKVWVVQGATVDVPFTARLLANGIPLSGQTLNWQVGIGSGTVTPVNSTTDGDGYARSTVHVSNFTADLQGTVCVAPGNNPCQTFYVVQVVASALKLQPVWGGLQTIRIGDTFQPIWVRVTNSAAPPNPVTGARVTFQSMMFLPDAPTPVDTDGDNGSAHHPMKVLLGSAETTPTTDANGLATLSPSVGGLTRPLQIEVMASAGAATPLQYELSVLPLLSPATGASTGMARRRALGPSRYLSDADPEPSEDREEHERRVYRQNQR